MKIPKTVKIAGFEWEVIYDVNVTRQGSLVGSCHFYPQKIFLDPETTDQMNEETFLHEILHVIWHNTGLAERFKGNPEYEEELVTLFSVALYQVLKDNKLLREKK